VVEERTDHGRLPNPFLMSAPVRAPEAAAAGCRLPEQHDEDWSLRHSRARLASGEAKEVPVIRVFLSHNHNDKPFVRRLATDLVQANLDVWIDEIEIAVGDSLIERIEEGIDSSDFLAVVLSHNSVASPWVREELHMALSEQINGQRIRVLPLKVDDCSLPGFLRARLYCDFSEPERYRQAFLQLTRDLGASYLVDSSADPMANAWYCIYCGWRCQLSYNDYFCHACRAVRPRPPEGSATVKFCPACRAGNIVIASFCEACGYRFGYGRT
jgi:hypothetical protein